MTNTTFTLVSTTSISLAPVMTANRSVVTTTNKPSKGKTMNIANYNDSVAKLKIETLVKLTHSSEFRGSFKPLLKAKSEFNYLSAVYERLDQLIVEGKIPVEFTMIPGMDKDITMVEEQIAKSLKGMVKLPMSDKEMELRKTQAFVEKFIAFGRLAETMMKLFPVVTGELEFGGHWYRVKKFAEMYTNGANKETVSAALKCASDMGIREEMVTCGKSLKAVKLFIWNNRYELKTNTIPGINSTGVYNGLRADVNLESSEVLKHFMLGRSVKAQGTYNVNATTLSSKYLNAVSRVIFVTENGTLYRYNVKGHVGGKATNLKNFCNHLSLSNVLTLISRLGVEMSSLLADDRNFIIVAYDSFELVNKETGAKTKIEKYKVCENPYKNSHIFALNAQHSFWGISSPDILKKGVLRAYSGSKGFAEMHEGGYNTYVGEANKMVARFIKLVKDGFKINLTNVMVVVDAMKDPKIIAALSTGAIHVPTDVLRKEGQCRVVSCADQGGMKATFGSTALLDPLLDAQGVTIASFGSLKSNLYGINELLGTNAKGIKELPVKTVSIGGSKVKVVIIPSMEVVVTNSYLINNFVPTNRDDLITSWDQANEEMALRIAQKASTVQEDSVFVDYIRNLRDMEFDGNLVECLKALVEDGTIKAKAKEVSVTSSEYDYMSYNNGRDIAVQWQNSLLVDALNKDDLQKDLMFKRAFEHNSRDYSGSQGKIKYMHPEDMYRIYANICERNFQTLAAPVGSFAKRDLLVDLCLELFDDEGGKYEYLVVQSNDNSIHIPLGEYLTGSFHKTSDVFNIHVSTTGFLPKILKHIAYGANALVAGFYTSKMFDHFASNVYNELTVDLIGKKLGRMKATGAYCVMQPSWWSNTVDKVFCTGFEGHSKEVLLAKHPELLEDSLTGATMVTSFPKAIIKGLSPEVVEDLNFVFQSTIFIPEDMLLAVLNDCDGDLLRYTTHKGMKFPHFEAKSLKSTFFAHKWHQAYKKDEQNFTSLKYVAEPKFHNMVDVMDAINDSAYAKSCVALFTSNSQRLAQRAHMDTNLGKTYELAQRILNIWVQEYAMNAIKRNSGAGSSSEDLMLPEFFFTWELHEECRGIGAEKFEDFLTNIMKIDMRDEGYKDNADFIEQFTVLLESIQDVSDGSKMVGKDITLADARKGYYLDLTSLNGLILQDRLVLAYAKKLGLI